MISISSCTTSYMEVLSGKTPWRCSPASSTDDVAHVLTLAQEGGVLVEQGQDRLAALRG